VPPLTWHQFRATRMSRSDSCAWWIADGTRPSGRTPQRWRSCEAHRRSRSSFGLESHPPLRWASGQLLRLRCMFGTPSRRALPGGGMSAAKRRRRGS
jgi:hypothetical protein